METQEKQLNKYTKLSMYLRKNVILPSFVELITKTNLKWLKDDESAVCNCPMSWHKDRNASCHMNKMEDGTWLYNCFGCGSHGNIVNFYMEYSGEEDYRIAINNICEKMNINESVEVPIEEYQYSVSRVDKKRKLETENIIVSNQCRLLLRKNYNKYNIWVDEAYKRLNNAIDEYNYDEVEKIGHEVFNKISENL